jgi:hypothetical protein
MKYCTYCGKECADDVSVCPVDSNPVRAAEVQSQSTPAQSRPQRELSGAEKRFLIIVTWVLVGGAFILTTAESFVLPGLLCVTSLIIRMFLHRHGFSVIPNGLIFYTCSMWWSASRHLTTPTELGAARIFAVVTCGVLCGLGIARDVQVFRAKKEADIRAASEGTTG